jgi:hypothetical protein
VPPDGGVPVRLDFIQIAVDGNGIPTLGYTTPDGGSTTASRLEPPAADGDGDGVENIADNCPAAANPGQADGDADGTGDVCDNCTVAPNPSQCDTNGDGFGNHCDADLDNNGIVNQIDLGRLRDEVGSTAADNDADLDCNGVVNQIDLGRLRESYGDPPGPSALAP